MMAIAGGPAPDSQINEIVKLKGITATALADVLDAGGAGVIYGVDIDCSLNSAQDVYLKFENLTTATPGTTVPHMQLKGKKGKITSYMFPRGILMQGAGTPGITAWCTTGKTIADTTDPTGTVNVTLVCDNSP